MKNKYIAKRSSINAVSSQHGFLLVSLLVAVFIIIAIGLATSQIVTASYRVASEQFNRTNVQLVTDAGADYAIDKLNEDTAWSGTAGEVTLTNTGDIKTTFEATVGSGADQYHKILTVTGRTYRPASAASPETKRTFEVMVRAVTSGGVGGSSSVVTGVGGLDMTNSAKILGGEVYINGYISMSNNSQIGQTSQPISVNVAHQSCPDPPDATYPRVCNMGESGEPITLTNNAHIYGEVKANNQTNGSRMSSPGLVAGAVTPATLPTYDRDAQKAAVASTLSSNDAECDFPFNNTNTWPANLKITGDVSLSNGCDITVQGNVWITGELSLSNSSKLIVANGLTDMPVVMVDGQNGVSASNSSEFASNSADIGFRILTYWSAASCSPDCADVTGSDLYDSQDVTTIDMGNGSEGPNTSFYARWSAVEIGNAGLIGAVAGQTIKLTNSSAITFGTSVSGGSGGVTIAAWVVESYKRVYN